MTDRARSAASSLTRPMRRVCIVGASGKLGQYMTQHALDRGYEVVAVCREESVAKLARFAGRIPAEVHAQAGTDGSAHSARTEVHAVASRITVMPGRTDDRELIARAVAGCDGVLVVLAPMGMRHYATRFHLPTCAGHKWPA